MRIQDISDLERIRELALNEAEHEQIIAATAEVRA